ncbi:unnamed protein product [Amoebophrya sp. A25]|nr:unnamed protein product [Amoebophrya sp. A25]|eukprot:GSA25T00020704001.1
MSQQEEQPQFGLQMPTIGFQQPTFTMPQYEQPQIGLGVQPGPIQFAFYAEPSSPPQGSPPYGSYLTQDAAPVTKKKVDSKWCACFSK